MEDWQEYADLLLYSALSKHWEGKDDNATALFNKAKNMWDGVGINDKAAKDEGYYAIYKLGLLLYASKDFLQICREIAQCTALYFAWWLGWLNQFLLLRIGGTCGF